MCEGHMPPAAAKRKIISMGNLILTQDQSREQTGIVQLGETVWELVQGQADGNANFLKPYRDLDIMEVETCTDADFGVRATTPTMNTKKGTSKTSPQTGSQPTRHGKGHGPSPRTSARQANPPGAIDPKAQEPTTAELTNHAGPSTQRKLFEGNDHAKPTRPGTGPRSAEANAPDDRCTSCNKPMKPSSTFCCYCGTPRTEQECQHGVTKEGSIPCCHHCGTPMEEAKENDVKWCASCGNPWLQQGPHCRTCGKKSEEPTTDQPQTQQGESSKEGEKRSLQSTKQEREPEGQAQSEKGQRKPIKIRRRAPSNAAAVNSNAQASATTDVGELVQMQKTATPPAFSAATRWDGERGSIQEHCYDWIADAFRPKHLPGNSRRIQAKVWVMSETPVQMITSWRAGGRVVHLSVTRNDRITKESHMAKTLEAINRMTAKKGQAKYDHVSIWEARQLRLIDCSKDPEVVIIALTPGLQLESPDNEVAKKAIVGNLAISPKTAKEAGKFLNITPTEEGSTWLEVRRTNTMQRKSCTSGDECTHDICGWSNHGESYA
jgi:hypothetical protein